MEKINYMSNGLTGLANLGNTCFINSCIQVLTHIDKLNEIFDENNFRKKLNKTSDSLILIEYDNLRRLMWSKNCIISPSGWIKTIHNVAKHKGNLLFTDYSQNDTQEFLLFLIDCFHNSLKREVEMNVKGDIKNNQDNYAKACFDMVKKTYEKDYSEIFKLFYGVHIMKTISVEDKNVIKFIPEPYFILDLPMTEKKEPNLYDCLDCYLEGEVLDGDNAWYNENTKEKENVIRQINFWSFPDVLVISIKRFTNSLRKDQRLVHFPINDLDLRKYASGYDKDTYLYDLCGVCNHSGNLMGGHYIAYVKNIDNLWYCFNDTQVNKITDVDKIVSTYAYCLFYKKKNK